jgi:hypothetical protein
MSVFLQKITFYMKHLYLILFVFSFFACKNEPKKSDKPFSNCKCGKPEPIFKEGGEVIITDRNFTMTKDSGIENISFNDGTELQVIQSGCNEIIQEFTFSYKKDDSKGDAEFWKDQAVIEFKKIGSISDRYFPFKQWAAAIEAAKPMLKIGEAVELEKDFFVTIDKIQNGSEMQLIVKLHAKSC